MNPTKNASKASVTMIDEDLIERARAIRLLTLDVDGVRTVQVGIALWVVGFVATLPFYGRLRDAGHGWMIWTCAAGCGLGLLGLEYCRRRRKERAAQQAEA